MNRGHYRWRLTLQAIMDVEGPLDGASGRLVRAPTAQILLEPALLAGVGIFACRAGCGTWWWLAAIFSAVCVATEWSLSLSPQAAIVLHSATTLDIEAKLFIGAGAGLVGVGPGVAGAIGVAIWLDNRVPLTVMQSR